MANTQEKKSAYHEKVAQLFIEKLKEGKLPFSNDWEGFSNRPVNASTGKAYRGGNSIWLSMQPYEDPRWMTMKQANALGMRVKKGEKATHIVYFSRTEERVEENEEGEKVKVEVELARPKIFTAFVFNGEQIEGMPPMPEIKEHKWNPVERAEDILKESGAKIKHVKGNKARYNRILDDIQVPLKEQFYSAESYYSTVLHELSHWTGHESRLNRDMEHAFGSKEYAKEELRAEIASYMINSALGLKSQFDNNASYVQSWISVLEDDPKELFRAAADAENILQYVAQFDLKHDLLNEQAEALKITAQEHKEGQSQEESQSLENSAAQNNTEAKTPEKKPETHQKNLDSLPKVEYINVRYEERLEAKKLGAKWDGQKKSWYIPQGVDREPFQKWFKNPVENNKIEHAEHGRSVPESAPKPSVEPQKTVEKPERSEKKQESGQKQYLFVQYQERFEAKSAGAKWDPAAKSWYVGEKADLEKLAKFMKPRDMETPTKTPQEEFADSLKSLGAIVESVPVMDGKPHRIKTLGDKQGEQSGFYIGYTDGRPAGYMCNNRTGASLKWKYTGKSTELPLDKEALERQIKERQEANSVALAESHERVAKRCRDDLIRMPVVLEPTGYIQSKGISVHYGVLKSKYGDLVVPARDAEGKVWTMQYIRDDGLKRFVRGGRKEGTFHVVGPVVPKESAKANPQRTPVGLEGSDTLFLCEGYATAATVAEVTGKTAVATFDSSNLVKVAQALHDKMPDHTFVICGDDDHALEQKSGRNPGRTNAEKAAEITGGVAVFPVFSEEEKAAKLTDFNDMAVKGMGRESCAMVLTEALKRAQTLKAGRQGPRAEKEQQQQQTVRRGR